MTFRPEKNEKAMEGRTISKEGKDLGDARFHETGWKTTPEAAQLDLERLAAVEEDLAEQQAETFAAQDKNIGMLSFKGLIELHPTSARVEHWKKRIEELKRK